MAESLSIFRKIEDKEEHKKVFDDLALRKESIICKGMDYPIYLMRVYRHTQNDILMCSLEEGSPTPNATMIPNIICSFQLGTEKYYFQTKMYKNRNDYTFGTREDLFLLQRRKAYRIRIPLSYKAGMEIKSVDNKTSKVPAMIYDLSARGARIVVPKSAWTPSVGQVFTGALSLVGRAPISISATVKHFKTEAQARNAWSVGVEYLGLTEYSENFIHGVTMDLHRELFKRWLK